MRPAAGPKPYSRNLGAVPACNRVACESVRQRAVGSRFRGRAYCSQLLLSYVWKGHGSCPQGAHRVCDSRHPQEGASPSSDTTFQFVSRSRASYIATS